MRCMDFVLRLGADDVRLRRPYDVRGLGGNIACRCGLPVGGQRVGELAGGFTKWPLGKPRHQWRRRRREVGHLAKSGEDVVRSNGGCHVPNNYSKYDT